MVDASPDLPIDVLPTPLLVFDAGHAAVAANPAACTALDRDTTALLGTAFVDSLTVGSAAAFREALDTLDTHAGTLTVSRPPADPDDPGADDYFDLRLGALPDGRIVVAVHDVTEKHRLDAAIAALASATVALDGSASMVWRPFGNAARFGVDDDDALGNKMLEFIHPDELPRLLELFTKVVNEPTGSVSELVRMRHPYVEDGWLLSRITAVNCLDDPAMRAVVVRTEDTAPPDLVGDLTRTTGHFHSLAEAAPVGILVTDPEGALLYRNELASRLLGLAPDAVGTTRWLADIRSDSPSDLAGVFAAALRDQARGTVLASVDHDEPTPTWLRVDAVPQLDEQGRPFGMIATLLDVTFETEARKRLADAQQRLWHLATHDHLTGLANRVLYLERVEDALARRAAEHHNVALLYCDLDGFKPVNDRYGHAVGDAVLKVVAQRLTAIVRGTDMVCRFGGDEFLVLVDGFDDADEVRRLADRLAAAVAAPLTVDGITVEIGITVGMALPSDSVTVDELITQADHAMYAAKAERRR